MKKACRICVYGIVQGVGFRPFVSRLADSLEIKGSVANKGSYVDIIAEGGAGALETFIRRLRSDAPERSAILKIGTHEKEPENFKSFEIIESEKESGNIFVSPDIATCPECRRELYDKKNRRYMHPFINCTACGPRLTILEAMPYDRERTTMSDFPMCCECSSEYYDPETRRYDAQPVCCNECGPEVYIVGSKIRGKDAITFARHKIAEGKVIAVKGIGGFHLCCDAKNEAAVSRLRTMKNRPAKPFAVMMKDIGTVERECNTDGLSEEMKKIIDGPQKPILLLKKRPGSLLAPSVAPDNPKVGVMLPYAPVQMLLFEYDDGFDIGTDMFVMTSGNVSGAPICRTDDDARNELSGFCDAILSHNRRILLRADDSVMDIYKGEPYMIRRSRGYAPLPVMLGKNYSGAVLGIGGELKNTFCIAKNELLYESPYIGDMADIRTVNALRESVKRMQELLETKCTHVIADMHPRYNTVAVAEELGLPVINVQHHYAHILACMAENDFHGEVIGISFDGTGFGTDGTIWGGEILKCSASGFERTASISPFIHVGGDIASKEGWRIAVSMVGDVYGDNAAEKAEELGLCERNTAALILNMKRRGLNSVKSTSAGRLFDAVSAVLGIRRNSTFEGEAATTLQFRAEEYIDNINSASAGDMCVDKDRNDISAYDGNSENDPCAAGELSGSRQLRTDILFKNICNEFAASDKSRETACRLAYYFHKELAHLAAKAAVDACVHNHIDTTALSGGVFQNTLLLRLTEDEITQKGIKVIRHHLIPPNDGGIALGQAFYGIENINKQQ